MFSDFTDTTTALRWHCPSVALGKGAFTHAGQRAAILGYLLVAERAGCRAEAVDFLRQRMRDNLEWHTLTQRKWQTSVSRRPSRGRHHDSWDIRERHVAC